MLSELKVKNFAIIDEVTVAFKSGFNVLSGETGSGKSVMLKSLALLMGEKSSTDTIKTGAQQATVEGAFDISKREDVRSRLREYGLDDTEDLLVVRRILALDGKNRVYLNGALATLTQLKEVVAPLVEVTGRTFEDGQPLTPLIEMTAQHENRNLQSKAYHLDLLDQYLGLLKERGDLRLVSEKLAEIRGEIAALEQGAREKEQRLDFLTYQRDEITSLDLKPGEDTDLEGRLNLLRSAEKLQEFIADAESALYSDEDSALVRVHRIVQKSSEFSNLIPRLQTWSQNLTQAKALLEDAVYELRDLSKDTGADAETLQDMEDRLSAIRKLKKKHGRTVEDILENLKLIEAEISQLENSELSLEGLRAEERLVRDDLHKRAEALHVKRKNGLKTLVESVNAELSELNMKGVLFGANLEKLKEPSSSGVTDVEFTIQASKKDEPRPLAKFASGGELSRILLSVKRVVGHSDQPRTYLFDEVDAGVSGVTAEKVGRKLKAISKGQQVICVTHLPQVAAFADAHFVISKSTSSKEGVRMRIQSLKEDERVQEVARMLSGERITKASLENAKELIEGA